MKRIVSLMLAIILPLSCINVVVHAEYTDSDITEKYYQTVINDDLYYVDSITNYLYKIDNSSNESELLLQEYIMDMESDEECIYVTAMDEKNGLMDIYIYDTLNDTFEVIPIEDDEIILMSENDDNIGTLSEKYESNGNPGTISTGAGDSGGVSFGAYQFASKYGVPKKFADWCVSSGANKTIGNRLKSAYSKDGNAYGNNFKSEWKAIAKEDAKKFLNLQHSYTKKVYYDAAVTKWQSAVSGFKVNDYGITLKNVIWSRAVQHGSSGSKTVFVRAINSLGGFSKQSEETLIKAIYKESGAVVSSAPYSSSKKMTGSTASSYGINGKYMKYYSGCSSSVQVGVYKRLRVNEYNQALKMLEANQKIKIPEQPTIKSAVPQSNSSIKVSWNAVSGATSYKVGIRKAGEDEYKDTTVTGTSHIYNKLKANTTYYFRLYAVNSAGTSKRSVTFKTSTLTNTPEIPEENGIVTGPVRDSELVISWNAVAGADYYKIERYRGDEGESKAEIIAKKVKGTSYTDKNLKPNSKYWYRIYAVKNFADYGNEDSRGAKTFTSAASATRGKFTRISTPTITQNDSTPNKVTLKWTKVYGGNTYQYKVWKQAPTDKELKTIKTTTDLSYTDTSLKPGNVYKYKIETVTTKDSHCTNTSDFYVAPKISQAPTVTPKSGTEMAVSWDKVASPVKIKYAVVRKVNGKETVVVTTTNNSYTDTGLSTDTTYSYYVKVLDNSGNVLTTTGTGSAVLQILPTGISVSKTAVNLAVNKTEQLTANITPKNATSKNVTWTSSNSSIATVSSTGLVTAKAAGTATITAKTANGKSATATITVAEDPCVFGEWITDKEPTCTEEGHKYRICERHSEKEEAVIEAKGHSYSEEMIVTKEATCNDEGEKAYVCSVCKDKKDVTLIEKLDHSFGEWITEKSASCNESGLEYRVCGLCELKETKDIETTTHNYELTAETETTPDGPGSRTYTCSTCQDEYTEVYVPEVAEGEIIMGSAAPRPGESVTIPVTISENPGITGFELALEYDKNALIPTEINSGDLLTSGLFMSTLDSGVSAEDLETIKVIWSNDTAITGDGELFNITFEVKSNAQEGSHAIGLNYEKGWITDENFYDVMPSIIDNSITVADVLMGDINQDRRIDSRDNILLAKHLAKIPGVKLNENQIKAANVHHDEDKDGSPLINIKDSTRLAMLLAGYQFGEVEAVSLMSAENIDITVESTEA